MAISRGFPPSNTISPSVRITEKDLSFVPTSPSFHRAGLVGFASKGPINVPTLINSTRQLHTVFGYPHPDTSDPYLLYAAEQFLAVGNELYVVRCGDEDPVSSEAAQIASVNVPAAGALVTVTAHNAGPYTFDRDTMFRWRLNGILASKVLAVPAGTYTTLELAFDSVNGLNAQLNDLEDGIEFDVSADDRLVLRSTWAYGPDATIELVSVQNSMVGNTVVDTGGAAVDLACPVQMGTDMTIAKTTGLTSQHPATAPAGTWTFSENVVMQIVVDGTDNVNIDNVVQTVTIPFSTGGPSGTPITYTTATLVDAINNTLPDPLIYVQPSGTLPGGWISRANGNHIEIVTKHCGKDARLLVKPTGNAPLILGLSSTTAVGSSPSAQSLTPIDNRDTLGIISGTSAPDGVYTFKLLADSTGTEGNGTSVLVFNDLTQGTFTLDIYNNNNQVEIWGGLSKDPSSSYYVETFLATVSDYIRCEDNTTLDPSLALAPPLDNTGAGYLLSGGSDGIPADPDDQDTLIIGNQSAYTGLYSLSEPEQIDIDLVAVPGHSSTKVILGLIGLCEIYRQDCIAIIDPPFGLTPREITQWANGTHPLNNRKLDSDFAALYWPWVKISDTYNNVPMWVPPSGVVMAMYARSDTIGGGPWFAPAGETRGLVSGITDVFSRPTLQERDDMYGNRNAINPIIQFADNANYVVWGQKTLQRRPTALDRVNVRRMMFYIEKQLRSRCRALLFDPHDEQFRSTFVQIAQEVLAIVKLGRGLTDYRIQADSELNTSDVIDRNEFRARIGVQPTKAVEFIFLEFSIHRTGDFTSTN